MANSSAQPKDSDDTYPRPDFRRREQSWQSLNGPWDFYFDDEDIGETQLWHKNGTKENPSAVQRTINVPFVFQSSASGINEGGVHEVLWYKRSIDDIRTPDQVKAKYRLIVRFGAVDYSAKVWLNGERVGEHRGGHVPFDCDITDALKRNPDENGQQSLTVRVFDSAHDLTQPRGKQYWKPEPQSIFYTPSGGIWQSVWLESVPPLRIADSSHGTMLRSNDIKSGLLDSRIAVQGRRRGQKCAVQVEASLAGVLIRTSDKKELPQDKDFVRYNFNLRLTEDHLERLPKEVLQTAPLADLDCWRNGVALWSPEHPLLYDLTIRIFDVNDDLIDEVMTSTGMRSINWTAGDGTLRLNGRPYFQALLLDQGYWPSTLMTPPTPNALKNDIELSKAMGFNGCRKHQKVEDPIFMYWADQLGFLVWGEMASSYRFSVEYVERYDDEWLQMVRRDINHPSVVAWTLANESWGYPELSNNPRQRDHLRSLYYKTKTLDPTRPINGNCGWEHATTDLSTFHDYADAGGMEERCKSVQTILNKGKSLFLNPIHGENGAFDPGSSHTRGAPILCTEFGGVNIAPSKDEEQKTNWGYTTAKDSDDLLKRVENIIMATVKFGVVCGFVWTQLTDIEQEQNGLYTYDRKPKIPQERMKAIIERAKDVYFGHQS